MSESHLTSLQTAIHGRLSSDTALVALGAAIYDNVPTGSNYPYLVYGNGRSTRRTALGGLAASEVELQIAAYSRDGGRAGTLALLSRIETVLAVAPPTLVGAVVNWWRLESMAVALENDGVTWRGVVNVVASIETL